TQLPPDLHGHQLTAPWRGFALVGPPPGKGPGRAPAAARPPPGVWPAGSRAGLLDGGLVGRPFGCRGRGRRRGKGGWGGGRRGTRPGGKMAAATENPGV